VVQRKTLLLRVPDGELKKIILQFDQNVAIRECKLNRIPTKFFGTDCAVNKYVIDFDRPISRPNIEICFSNVLIDVNVALIFEFVGKAIYTNGKLVLF